jgi:hypothetical protein
LTVNIKFDFHGGSARLRNFKLLLNCRKKNQPDWIRYQTSKESLKISLSLPMKILISGLSWLWFLSVEKVFTNRCLRCRTIQCRVKKTTIIIFENRFQPLSFYWTHLSWIRFYLKIDLWKKKNLTFVRASS